MHDNKTWLQYKSESATEHTIKHMHTHKKKQLRASEYYIQPGLMPGHTARHQPLARLILLILRLQISLDCSYAQMTECITNCTFEEYRGKLVNTECTYLPSFVISKYIAQHSKGGTVVTHLDALTITVMLAL